MINIGSVLSDKLKTWGWPWHGWLHKDGAFEPSVIDLPNATQRNHPMPSEPWYSYRVKVPGVAPVLRSPEQLAADLTAGMEWRAEALLSGSSYQIYGRDLGGWVYCAADGSRWIIDLSAETAKRLGSFGSPSIVKPLTITWPGDTQQSTPAVLFDGSAPVVKRWPMPSDISSDGRKATLMLYCSDPNFDVDARPIPLGFLLAEVSGGLADAFSVSVTVLYSRSQTLGVATYDPQIVFTEETVPGIPYPLLTITGVNTLDITGRIWAAWFDDFGAVMPCTVDRYEETQKEGSTVSKSSYIRARIRWTLKLNGDTAVLVDLQSEESANSKKTTITGTLNNDVIYSKTTDSPFSIFPVAELTLAEIISYQVMRRNQLGSVNVGDTFDIMSMSNNLLMLYVRLSDPTGLGDPQHRYFGAATPSGPKPISCTETAPSVLYPARFRLYGPAPYSAYNPVTGQVAPLTAIPSGWI